MKPMRTIFFGGVPDSFGGILARLLPSKELENLKHPLLSSRAA